MKNTMKKSLNYGKNALSLFMAVLLLLTTWVCIATPEASASGLSYDIRITWKVEASGTLYGTYGGSDSNDTVGFTIFYVNESNEENSILIDLKNDLRSSGEKITINTTNGFPTKFLAYINDDRDYNGGDTVMSVSKIEVAENGTNNYTTLWAGYGYLNCTNLPKNITISPTESSGNNTNYAYVTDNYKNWVIPTQSPIKSKWFENGAYNGYNHDLAKFCADLVELGYAYDESSVSDNLTEYGLSTKSINMSADRDEINYFIADRNITVNGENKNLIVVGCIGSYKNQWYSNFDPFGKESSHLYLANDNEKYTNHLGFADARDYVYRNLLEYVNNYNVDTSNSIILLTGHSRGAATVNLLAVNLISGDSLFNINSNNIYTYGFATPNTTSSVISGLRSYNSIINIVNPEDFVTKVLPSAWGYRRYGLTYTLPSKSNDINYKVYLEKMRVLYDEYTNGEFYDPYKMGEVRTYNMVNDFVRNIKSMDEFYNKHFCNSYSPSIYDNYSSPYEFFKKTLLKYPATDMKDMSGIKDAIMHAVTHHDLALYMDILLYFAWPDMNSSKAKNAILAGETVFDGVELGGKFSQAHSMKTYRAYLNSMTFEEITAPRGGYKGSVNCPVDVEIYDKVTGELVGRITDNIVDEEIAAKDNSIVMYVEGDSKNFWLPSNGDYDVKLIGNNEGTMDYSLSEIDSDTGEEKRVNFFDIEITDGLTMTSDVVATDFIIENHELMFEDGEVLESSEVFTEEITTYNIETTSSKGGVVSDSLSVKSGDYVTLYATADEEWNLIGWFENGELLSFKSSLAFVAKNDRKLEVKFEHNHSYTSSITTPATHTAEGIETFTCSCGDSYTKPVAKLEGHTYTSTTVTPTCTADGLTVYTCACGDSYTVTVPATGHSHGDDGLCINCGEYNEAYDKTLSDSDNCSHLCHKSGFMGFIWMIVRIFIKLFKTNPICECGAAHY